MIEITSDLVVMAALLLVAGVGAGLIAGLLGVGGGIVVVPVLFHVFTLLEIPAEVRMHLAVGTSLATIIPTAISSARSHHKRGAVDWQILKSWAPAVVLGVIAGSVVAKYSSAAALQILFGVLALFVAFNMASGRTDKKMADHLPREPWRGLIGGAIGFFSAMMGIGGGTFSVAIMTIFGTAIHRAVGTASAIGLVIAVPGAIGFAISGLGVEGRPDYALGYVSLLAFAFIVPTTVLAAPLGVRLAHRLNVLALKRVFAAFLAVTAIRMFLSV